MGQGTSSPGLQVLSFPRGPLVGGSPSLLSFSSWSPFMPSESHICTDHALLWSTMMSPGVFQVGLHHSCLPHFNSCLSGFQQKINLQLLLLLQPFLGRGGGDSNICLGSRSLRPAGSIEQAPIRATKGNPVLILPHPRTHPKRTTTKQKTKPNQQTNLFLSFH